MKLKKKVLFLIGVMVMVFGLTACGGGSEEGTENTEAVVTGPKEVQMYTMDGQFNTDTTNLFRNLYIEDETNYMLIIEAYDSKDANRITTYYCERGTYTKNEDGSITLNDGDAIGYVLNGEIKMDWSSQATDEKRPGMDKLMDCDNVRTFTLNEDGTWAPVK